MTVYTFIGLAQELEERAKSLELEIARLQRELEDCRKELAQVELYKSYLETHHPI